MENNNNTAGQININDLTEAQMNEILKTASECRPKEPEVKQEETKKELVEGEALVTVDPVTGEKQFRPVDEADDFKQVPLEDLVDEHKSPMEQVTDDMEISDDDKKLYDLSDEDAACILSIIKRYRDGEKFSIYNAMPESLQQTVRNMAQSTDMRELGAAAKILIEQFASNLLMDKEYIDFQESLTNEIDKLNFANMYGDELKERMTVTLENDAKKLDEKFPDKAQKFREIKASFIDSYSYRIQKEALTNGDKVARRLDKDLKHFDRMCTSFNYKYKDSKMVIKDINLVSRVLAKVLPVEEYTTDEIKEFFILFMRITLNMHPDNLVEHAYMYYTLLLIADLEFMTDKSDFRNEILDNIKEVIKLIRENGIKKQ